MGVLYSKTKNINSDINSILFTNGWTDKTVEPDIGTVFMALCKLYTEQLGIVVTNCIVYI